MELNEFFKHGILEGFHLGMTLAQVQHHRPGIGFMEGYDPQVLISNTEEYEVYMYGGKVYGIVLNPRFVQPLHLQCADSTRHKLSSRTTMTHCVRLLDRASIGWVFEPSYTMQRQVAIRTAGGVDLLFDFDLASGALGKIGIFGKL